MAARKRKTVKKSRSSKRSKGRVAVPWLWAGILFFLLILFFFRHTISGIFAQSSAAAPSEPDKPKLVFVIDDIGYHRDHEAKLAALGDKVVYAILPMLPFSKYFGNLGHDKGADIILHLPLETVNGTVPGRGLITRQMDPAYVLETLDRNLSSVPHHIGANNHMGSLGTSDPALMKTILEEIKRRKLFFLDSVTTGSSVVSQVAAETGTPALVRDIFLDNIDAKQPILDQIKKQKAIARKKGYAIGIGHYRDTTLSVLLDIIPKLEDEGFEIVSLSKLRKSLS